MFDILDAYWIAGTNPTTQVFSSKAGVEGFVANNDANYQAWLANGDFGVSFAVMQESVGTAGVVRLLLDPTQVALLQTGQRGQVSGLTGSPAANGFRQITVIDATHIDLVGTTFVAGSAGGGTLAMPAIYSTDAALWATFDGYAQVAWKTAAQSVSSTGTNTAVPSPIGSVVNFTSTNILHSGMVLPKMRTPRAPPKGVPIRIVNTETSARTFLIIYANDGTTVLAFVSTGDEVQLVLTDNSTASGTWQVASITRNQGMSTVRNVIGKRNVTFTTDFDWACNLSVFVSATKQPAAYTLLSSASGSADIAVSGPGTGGGRDQAAAFVAGDTIHFYQLQSTQGLAQIGLCSKQAPINSGPILPTGFDRWAYVCSVVLIAGPVLPKFGIAGNYVYWQAASTDAVLLSAGAATAETTLTTALNALVPQLPTTKFRLFINATSTNANTLTLYNTAAQAHVAIAVAAGARVQIELEMPQSLYLAYKWTSATGTVDINVLGYNVGNGDS